MAQRCRGESCALKMRSYHPRTAISQHERLVAHSHHAPFTNGHQLDDQSTIIVDQGGSPDSISLAFPPLPLAFQPHCTRGNNTGMPSPVLGNAQIFSNNGETDYNGFGSLPENGTAFNGAGNGYEDLSSFFGYSFLPTQRISMFSGTNNG